jgi:hypothetical protein
LTGRLSIDQSLIVRLVFLRVLSMCFMSMLMSFIVAMVTELVVVWPQTRRVIREATFLCGALAACENFLNKGAVQCGIARSDLIVLVAVEVFATVDPRLLTSRLDGQR